MNINAPIWVQLNDRGWTVLRQCFEHLYVFTSHGSDAPDHIASSVALYRNRTDQNGWTEFQLWDFMEIFGDEMYMAAKPVIERNEIRLEAPDPAALAPKKTDPEP